MKNLILFLIVSCSFALARAEDYTLKDVCAADAKTRSKFAEKLRDSIIQKSKDIKSPSEEAEKFDGSDMQQWLKFTYPVHMPAYLYDGGAIDCAELHVGYLKALSLDANKKSADKLMQQWKSCLDASYRKDVRPITTRLFKCYSEEATPSK